MVFVFVHIFGTSVHVGFVFMDLYDLYELPAIEL